jgi:hypothetical protein
LFNNNFENILKWNMRIWYKARLYLTLMENLTRKVLISTLFLLCSLFDARWISKSASRRKLFMQVNTLQMSNFIYNATLSTQHTILYGQVVEV